MEPGEATYQKNQRIGALLFHLGEGAGKLAGIGGREGVHLDRQLAARSLNLLQFFFISPHGAMGKYRDAGQLWKTLFQELEAFCAKVRIDPRRSRDVSARPGETGDNPCLD